MIDRLVGMSEDASKLYADDNKAAVKRLKKELIDLEKECKELRRELNETRRRREA